MPQFCQDAINKFLKISKAFKTSLGQNTVIKNKTKKNAIDSNNIDKKVFINLSKILIIFWILHY
jgi:hypothetical protein